ncbi:MAG: 50S ribosomal protein L24 [Bacteroidales bacterium]|nr:50S ribosomal protein L24 [Bacteroidales bacterium]MBK7173535.1 50S ribosomal protein L24 [Bacteroidales bacterium]
MKLHIRKGDNVMVIAGDSKGRTGKVLEVEVEKYRAIVENVNLATKHTKPNAKNTKGGLVKQEMPIHISNLMLVDASGKPTRVGRKTDPKSNKSVRVSKKSGEVIK